MKLYKEVLIESAEQAEALPVGTVAMWPHGHFTMTAEGRWLSPGRGVQSTAGGLVGYTALVPIEAEEIHSEDYGTHHLLEAWTSTHPITAYFPKETQ